MYTNKYYIHTVAELLINEITYPNMVIESRMNDYSDEKIIHGDNL